MGKQTQKSGLMAKYGANLQNAAKKHANDETKFGIINLPGGITNGVAQLEECYFDQYKSGDYQGEWYFRASGVVIEPEQVQTPSGMMTVRGLHTSIMIPVCKTTAKSGEKKVTTLEEHVAQIQNEMRKLGAESPEDIEATAAALVEAAPYFRFTTEAGATSPKYPTPRIWENWNGAIPDYTPPEGATAEGGTQDETGDESEPEEEASEESNEEEATDWSESTDVDALVSAANEDDEEAKKRLIQLAKEAGNKQKAIDDAENWEAVGQMIPEDSSEEEEAGDEEESGEAEPAVEEIHKIKVPKDPKNPKKGLKSIEVEVLSVDKKNKTVTLKDLDSGKTLMDPKNPKKPRAYSWADLEQDS